MSEHQPGPDSRAGEQFLHAKESSLHLSHAVTFEQARLDRVGEETSTKPADKIADWMEVLDKTHGHEDPAVLDRIKASYHKSYVITPEAVPESAFLLEQRIARQNGHGDIPLTDEYRESKRAEIVTNQTASLDRWVDYLASDDALYPTWAKYWAFTQMTKMGRFEKELVKDADGVEHETARFATRTADTIAPFPPLNPRALALAIGVMTERLEQKGLPKAERTPVENASTKLTDPEYKNLLSSESFAKLYTQFLIELPAYSAEGLQETRGTWQKYSQGSDPQALVDSIEGYPLEWCTANVDTARTQLAGGDFYVYYSLDEHGAPIIPRVAIRMDGDSIAEVRGITANQNLDPYISEVVAEKMTEFPDGEQYQRRAADMHRLTAIEARHVAGHELTSDDLRFLYQIDERIQGFGYVSDPRIEELLQGRNAKTDIAALLGVRVDQVGTSEDDVLGSYEPLVYYYGKLDLYKLVTAEGLTLPTTVNGNLALSSLISAEGLTLPISVSGRLDLGGLTSAEGLTLPGRVGGSLILRSLNSADGLTLPSIIGGSLDLGGLTSAEGLMLPDTVETLYLYNLLTADGLTLPTTINGSLELNSLISAKGLTLPTIVGVSLDLGSLTSAEGLTLPSIIGGYLDLNGLTSAVGLTLPKTVDGYLGLRNLTSADGLTLPSSIGGNLDLEGLTSADGLTLPDAIGGDLALEGLTSADGLTLSEAVGGSLYLNSLTSAKGLVLPTSIGESLYLDCLASTEGLTLPSIVGGAVFFTDLEHDENSKIRLERPDLHISTIY